jgi:hypothetical protein
MLARYFRGEYMRSLVSSCVGVCVAALVLCIVYAVSFAKLELHRAETLQLRNGRLDLMEAFATPKHQDWNRDAAAVMFLKIDTESN